MLSTFLFIVLKVEMNKNELKKHTKKITSPTIDTEENRNKDSKKMAAISVLDN